MDWVGAAQEAIQNFKKPADQFRFAREWSSALGFAPAPDREVLVGVRGLLEALVGIQGADNISFADSWISLYNNVSTDSGKDVCLALLRRITSKLKGLNSYRSIIATSRDTRIVDTLVRQKCVKLSELERFAKQSPRIAIGSALFDYLVEKTALKESPSLWNELLATTARPADLMTRDESLAALYCASRFPRGDHLLVTHIDQSGESIQDFFIALVKNQRAALRFVEYLLLSRSGYVPRTNTKGSRTDKLLSILLDSCIAARPHAPAAASVIARVQLFMIAEGKTDESLRQIERRASEASVASAIGGMRSDESEIERPVVLTIGQIEAVVLRYMKGRTSGSGGKPAKGIVEHRAEVEVLRRIVEALSAPGGESMLRGRLEAAMYNIGVREIGVAGERVEFDSRFHLAAEGGILQGDLVQIKEIGYIYGEMPDGDVLARARVVLAD